MSCGIGHSHSSDLAWLWLWLSPAALALIRPLAWKPLYAVGVALKRKKYKNNNNNNKKKRVLIFRFSPFRQIGLDESQAGESLAVFSVPMGFWIFMEGDEGHKLKAKGKRNYLAFTITVPLLDSFISICPNIDIHLYVCIYIYIFFNIDIIYKNW